MADRAMDSLAAERGGDRARRVRDATRHVPLRRPADAGRDRRDDRLAAVSRCVVRQRRRDPRRRRSARSSTPGRSRWQGSRDDGITSRASRSRPSTSSAASASRATRPSPTSRRSTSSRSREVVRAAGEREAELAVAAATAAFPAWAALGAAGRADHLHRLADLIDANVERLAAVECVDMAMLLRSLRARVISRGARNYRSLRRSRGRPTRSASGSRTARANRVIRMPSGPAVVITPWNAPFMLSTWKTAPALAAGCTVILKPAEWSPLSCSLLADLVVEAGLAAGRLQRRAGNRRGGRRRARLASGRPAGLVHRLARDGACTSASPRRRTSSRSRASSAARGRCSSSPTPTSRRPRGRRRASTTTPARCASPARASSSRNRSPSRSSSSSTGSPTSTCSATRATTTRPSRRSIHPDHFARVAGFVERARANGDEIVRGGRPTRGRGGRCSTSRRWSMPRSNEREIVQREVFGPVLTFQTFADEEEAIALANSTPYGLSGIVYTGSAGAGRARRARRPRRDRLGQHVPRARPDGAVRRRSASRASAARAATTRSTSTPT